MEAARKAGPALIRGNIITDAVDGGISWGSRDALATVSSVEIVGNIIDGFGWSGIRLGWDVVGQPGALKRVLVRNNVVKASARSARAPAVYGWAGPGSEDWTIDGNIVTTIDAAPDRQHGILVETEGLWRYELYDGAAPPPDQPERVVAFPGFGSERLLPGSFGSQAPPPGRSFEEVGVEIPLGVVFDAATPGALRSLSISGNTVSAMDRAGICVRGAVSAYVVSGNLVGGPGGAEPSPATQGIWIRSTGPEGVALDGVVSANVVQGLDQGILISTRAGRQRYLADRIGDLGPVLVHDNICKNSRAVGPGASAAGIALECVAGTTARVNLQANRCYDDRSRGKTQDFGLMTLGDGALELFDPGNNDLSGNIEERSHDQRIPDDLGLGGGIPFQDPPRFGH